MDHFLSGLVSRRPTSLGSIVITAEIVDKHKLAESAIWGTVEMYQDGATRAAASGSSKSTARRSSS